MKRETSFEEKIIEVNDVDNYYVLKETIFNGKIYLMANKLIDEETPSQEMAILRVDNEPDGLYVSLEKDAEVLSNVAKIFQSLLSE